MTRELRIPPQFERPVLKLVLGLPPPLLRALAGRPVRSPDGLKLDQQVQLLLAMTRFAKEPELHEGALQTARERLDRSGRVLDFVDVDGVTVEPRSIPGGAGPLPARIYTPAQRGAGALVFFHGGGFALGSLDSHHGVCCKLAQLAGVTVIAIDYRLTPEHPFPAAYDDAVAATRWVIANAATLGLDARRVAVGGDSAGGNLAAAVAIALARDAEPPAFQLLVYPALDFTQSEASQRMFGEGYLLTRASMTWFIERYISGRELKRDPRVSPIFQSDLASLPRALVLTAGFDPLRDEGRKYAERLREAGNEVEHVCFEGMVHGFFSMGAVVHVARDAIELIGNRLRRALEG